MEIYLLCHHTLMVEDGAFSHKVDFLKMYLNILNLKGHSNCITGSRLKVILLNEWILPIGGASAVEVLLSTMTTPSSFFCTLGPISCSNSLFFSLIKMSRD